MHYCFEEDEGDISGIFKEYSYFNRSLKYFKNEQPSFFIDSGVEEDLMRSFISSDSIPKN